LLSTAPEKRHEISPGRMRCPCGATRCGARDKRAVAPTTEDRHHLRHARPVEAGSGTSSGRGGSHRSRRRYRTSRHHRRASPYRAGHRDQRKRGYRRLGPQICRYRARATSRPIHLRRARSQDLEDRSRALGIDVVVSGHSHVPTIDMVGGVLYLNPGSAGGRRFRLPITLATLDVTPDGLRPAIHDLGDG
jgi:hypothetical protein